MRRSRLSVLLCAIIGACAALLFEASSGLATVSAKPAHYARARHRAAAHRIVRRHPRKRRIGHRVRRRSIVPTATGARVAMDPMNAPPTERDVKDPDQLLTTPRNAPVAGAPNPLGPTVNPNPQR